MSHSLTKIIQYYDNISNIGKRLWKTKIALASFNLGEVLKIWCYDKNFTDLTTLEQSILYTQYLEAMLSKTATTGKYQDRKIETSQWRNCLIALNNGDDFLHTKVETLVSQEKKRIVDSILDNIGDIDSLEFSTLIDIIREFLQNNLNQLEQLLEVAQKIDNIAYPLTAEYFFRYIDITDYRYF